MTVEEWRAVPDNPRQRNTERRLKKARHLDTPSAAHLEVKMASGKTFECKIDGHTRSLKWEREPHTAPTQPLLVTVYPVKTLAEAAELYTHFDSPQAVESPSDRVSGAFHEIGFEPASVPMRRGAVSAALQLTHTLERGARRYRLEQAPTVYEIVKLWEKEIILLDGIMARAIKPDSIFKMFSIAAALLTLRKDGAGAARFWDEVGQDRGFKTADECDGIEALRRVMAQQRSFDVGHVVWLTGKCLSCYERWRRHETYKLKHFNVKETDPATYLGKPGRPIANPARDVISLGHDQPLPLAAKAPP